MPPSSRPACQARATTAPPTPASQARTTPAPSTPASLGTTSAIMVESKPSGANVRVDGRLVGQTPLKLMSVAAGDHSIVLEHDGYRRWSSLVRLFPGKPSRVTASLER